MLFNIIIMSYRKNSIKCDKSQLADKYGLESVEALLAHLQNSLQQQRQHTNLNQTQKLRDQIDYLRLQRERFMNKQKQNIKEHIINCIEDEQQNILQQLQTERKKDLQSLIDQMTEIEQQMQIEHQCQLMKKQEQLNLKLPQFECHTSPNIINLTKQLDGLCKLQRYDQASNVKYLLQKQITKHSKKKYYEWKNYRDNQMKNLMQKQTKQRQALRERLQTLFTNQANFKNQQYKRLKKKIEIYKNKLSQNLSKQIIYKKQINSLSGSRFRNQDKKNNQFIDYQSKILCQIQPQTGPSSIAHTFRCRTPDKKQTRILQ